MNLSILIPSRNNLEFLKLAYHSIRKTQGNHFVEVLVLDDKSDKDNTWEWCLETMVSDPNFKAFKNEREERLGISGGYKFLSQQATQDVIGHWHADMCMTEGTLDEIERELFRKVYHVDIGDVPAAECEMYIDKIAKSIENNEDQTFRYTWIPNEKNVVSLTRIEPPIYAKSGLYPEKIVWEDAPIEAEEWDDRKFLNFLPTAKKMWNGRQTGGHFAPFFMFREEYNTFGSNDLDNFQFQAREDSDLAFRLVLAGFKTIQIPTFVYHFASRGNRRSKHEHGNYQDNPEWKRIDEISTRNFIRKWGTFNLHKDDLTPIKPTKRNVGFILRNCGYDFVSTLEPWCDRMVCPELDRKIIDTYIEREQPNTKFNLKEKLEYGGCETDVIVEIDGQRFNQPDFINIQHLSDIVTQANELGEFELGNLKITIRSLQTYEKDLIVCKNEPITLK